MREIADTLEQLTSAIQESQDTQRQMLDEKLQQLEALARRVEEQLAALVQLPVQALEGEPEKVVTVPVSDSESDIPAAVETVTPGVEQPNVPPHVHMSIYHRRKAKRQGARGE
jgi:hypothetical protein